jgi:GTPase SAR1 family protein
MGTHNSKVQETPSKSVSIPQKPSTNNELYRMAINQSAILGSFYDARKDCLLENSALQIPPTSIASQKPDDGLIITSGAFEEQNLIDMIGIDGELWLSINLKMMPQTEIMTLFDSSIETKRYTRFLYYYYPSVQQYITDNKIKTNETIPESVPQKNVTHVVTTIKSGIRALMMIQVSPDEESNFDGILEKIKNLLNTNSMKIKPNEKDLLDRFTFTKVFSNISDLNRLTKLTDICQKIFELKPNLDHHRPLEYTLLPIRLLCPSYPEKTMHYVSLNPKSVEQIHRYLYQLSFTMKSFKIPADFELRKPVQEHLKHQYHAIQKQIVDITHRYSSEINRMSALVLGYRSGNFRHDTFMEALNNGQDKGLLTEVNTINDRLNDLQEKVELINTFKKQNINYLNIEQFPAQQDDTLQTIEQKLLDNNPRKRIFCCNDELRKKHSSRWNDVYMQLLNERKTDPQLELVYADFSYCSYHLLGMKILPFNDTKEQLTRMTSWTPPPEEPVLTDNFINVLLLGESGVGKSTFINAVVNYLMFGSLREARSGPPIVLIPASFVITYDNEFTEHLIQCGDPDSNENYDHSGQSVTQRCRSYVFTISTQSKLRLIDTPGMGDARGLGQDDYNMQHILSFINNLSHLDAICILLKPNESRLNIVFRSYFTRLLGFLGENGRNNIIFCFTNTRQTSFAIGDTGPLLKQMLESHSIKDIPFKKTNTFCLDNESFRYLAARLNGIKFDDDQKEEYKQSWITSVDESNRLLQYICTDLQAFSQKDWRSIEHAQFQITQLVRPMLETTRNTMRNMIILNKTSSKSLIKLRPVPVAYNSTVCLGCERSPILYGDFWIVVDDSHILSDRCNKCQCYFLQHMKIDYKLEYEIYDHKGRQSLEEIRTSLDHLKRTIRNFTYFFNFIACISKDDDPILAVLNRMMNEEKIICVQHGTNSVNSNLHVELKIFISEYEQAWATAESRRLSFSLSDAYKIIHDINQNSTVKGQLFVIKQIQERDRKEHEKYVL